MIERIRPLALQHRQFLLYTLIGATGVTLDLVAFFVLYNVVDVHEGIATAISTTLGIVNNFTLNTVFNFKVRDRLVRRLFKFYAVGLSGILLTEMMFLLFVGWMNFDANLVKLASLGPVLVLQYSLNKWWTFKAHHHRNGEMDIEAFKEDETAPPASKSYSAVATTTVR